MTVPVMPLSFSRLSTFEQCEAKFEYLYVLKSVKDSDNEFTIYGTRVHDQLEKYGKGEITELSEETEVWRGLLDRILAQAGEKHFEYQMALTRDKTPTDWFAKDVWLRGIADVLVINGDKAYCLDWKTGKVKDNPTQLQLFAAMVFATFPEVQSVTTSFIWLHHNETTNAKFERSKVGHIWNAIEPRLVRVQDAVEIGVFKTKPSALCRWCPARPVCGDAR
jgi:hypothetical protein